MRRSHGERTAFLLFAGICATSLFAAQPWTKDSSHWTQEDVQHILQASPWAQTAQAAFAKGLMDQTVSSTSLPDGSSAGLPGGKARWDGGVGRPIGTDLPTIPVTIRWDSAAPVRLALSKAGDTLPPAGDGDYVITVLGLWPGEAAKHDGEEGEKPKSPDASHVQQELMGTARLIRRGKTAVAPKAVEVDPSTGAIRIAFSKQDPITLDDKEVIVSAQFGPLYILKKFRVKDMMYAGTLAL